MDKSDTEMSRKSDAEEQMRHQEGSEIIGTSNNILTFETKESICEESANEMHVENVDKSKRQKDVIEILKIELVSPSLENHNEIFIENKNTENNNMTSEVEIPVIEKNQQLESNEELGATLNSTLNLENINKNDSCDNVNFEENLIKKTEESCLTFKRSENKQDSSSNICKPLTTNNTSALSLLAQYNSDNDDELSETESVIEVPTPSMRDYRKQVVEIDSEDDSDIESLNELRKTIEKRIEAADEDDEIDENEDDSGKKKYKQKLRVKGELLLEDLPPIQDLQITVPEDECIEFGKIHSVVDQLVLVSALPNSILLDLETVIFLERGRKVLGEVFDVLGQVADPLYCVRFNSNKDIKEKQINVGDVVYVAPKTQYTQYIVLSSIMNLKGSDASWEHDIEPPPRFLDYSDDEQEQLAKRQLRNKDRSVENDNSHKEPSHMEKENHLENESSFQSSHQESRVSHRRSRRGSGHYNSSYNAPHQYQQWPHNYYRNSWHSNYYSQPFFPQSTMNSEMPPYNQTHRPHIPMYVARPPHAMPYHPPLPYVPAGALPMSTSFNIRPPVLYGQHLSSFREPLSPPPPPPGI